MEDIKQGYVDENMEPLAANGLLRQQLHLWHFLQYMGGFLPTCS